MSFDSGNAYSAGSISSGTDNGSPIYQQYATAHPTRGAGYASLSPGNFYVMGNGMGTPSAFTLACWVRTADGGGSYRGIIHKQSAYSLLTHDNRLGTYAWCGSEASISTQTINDNQWHHIGQTYDGSTFRWYYDGTEVHSYVKCVGTSGSDITVGRGAGTTEDWTGDIDEVAMWTRQLASTEMAALVTSGIGLS